MASRRARIIRRIEELRVSAIIRADDREVAAEAMRAAIRGGFRMIEFTLTTPGALDLIREFSPNADLLVGAGTVLWPAEAGDAVRAGASFIVSPVFDPEIVAATMALDAVSIPGTSTPTEMLHAHRSGADLLKLFPFPWADKTAAYLAAILAPLPELRIFPTAGVTPENFVDVLRAGAAGVGFAKVLFPDDELARRDYASIEQRAAGIMAKLNAETPKR